MSSLLATLGASQQRPHVAERSILGECPEKQVAFISIVEVDVPA
jgi:hypothetical protein